MNETLTIIQPDDWHVHLRDQAMAQAVTPYTAAQFGRALVMPNLTPPVTNLERALDYRSRIMDYLPKSSTFDPKMSIYLTDNTSKQDVIEVSDSPHVLGFKLYPAGATTNSDSGVTRITDLMPIFETMAQYGVVLQVHGEVTDPNIDVFDREAVFIEQVLSPLHREVPELKIVLEHITTREGAEFVAKASDHVGATITPQHLMFNRNEIFRGGIQPHKYCLPILKREQHRQALIEAAISGNPSFFLGSDSAPHTRHAKESACGCAGIFSAHAAIEFYAQVFDSEKSLDKLEGFASLHGARFYGLPNNQSTITLSRKDQVVPGNIPINGQEEIIPLMANETLQWSVSN